MKFLLDTNFLMAVGQFKIDIFHELMLFGKPEFFTLDVVVRELEKLAAGKGKDKKAARLALTLVEKKGVKVLESGGKDADMEIERVASEEGFTVCTTDKELAERLKSEEVLVIGVKQKKKLAVI
ncbi:MAG: PIN domain-containing protein [Candidatus Aenigmarchaeota archaeon]